MIRTRLPVALLALILGTGCSSDDKSSGRSGGGSPGGEGGGGGGGGEGAGATGGSTGSGAASPGGDGGAAGGATSTGGGGSTGTGGASAGGDGGASAGGAALDGGALTCPAQLNATAPVIAKTCSNGVMPVGSGGTFADGLYYLTTAVDFDASCSSGSDQGAIEISGNQWRLRNDSESRGGTFSVSGSTVDLTECGSGTVTPLTFSAYPTGFTLFNPANGDVRAFDLASSVDPDAGTCSTTLANDGADVPELAGVGTPPTMTGGTLLDGTYLLSDRRDWQGTCGCTRRTKLVISDGGTHLEALTRTDSDPDTIMSASITYSGTEVTLSFTCPPSMSLVRQYSVVTGATTELHLYNPTDQALEIFQLQ